MLTSVGLDNILVLQNTNTFWKVTTLNSAFKLNTKYCNGKVYIKFLTLKLKLFKFCRKCSMFIGFWNTIGSPAIKIQHHKSCQSKTSFLRTIHTKKSIGAKSGEKLLTLCIIAWMYWIFVWNDKLLWTNATFQIKLLIEIHAF